MTSALARTLAGTPKRPARPCIVGRILADLAQTDAEAAQLLTAALAGSDWTNHALSRVLASDGRTASYSSIANHRKNICRCVEAEQ